MPRVASPTARRLAATVFPIMADGLALDGHGNLYLTILTRNAVLRRLFET